MSTECPAIDQLRAFAIGSLPSPVLEEMAQHICHCPQCDAILEALDDYADPLVTELRSLKPPSDTMAVPEEVITGARNVTSTVGLSSSDISLDPGRRYARHLQDGPCRLGRFELQAELGEGAFGYVFRALDLELDRIVAVKIQRAGSFASAEDVHRFLREARAAAQLQHPGIVALYESGQTEDGVCFLVTEHISGETMEARLQAEPLPREEAARLVLEMAQALQYAHEHGIVHRDMKPSNVILDEQGHCHITDFGLAKRMAGDLSMTSDGRVMGTPSYMSPEQARGDSHHVDARSDVYSLGVMLYELLTGERPFQGNRRLLLLQVLEDEPRPLRQLSDQVPKDLETICLKAMAKAPTRRYQTAGELAEDLERFLDDEPIQARPMGRAERLWRWCRRYPLAPALLLAVLTGSVIGFWYLSHLSRYFIEKTAVDSARMEAEIVERVMAFYSEEIVDRVDQKKVKVSHEYAVRRDAIPLPATFGIDAGRWISKGTTGMQVRLYSDHPWRSDGGPKDDFERQALDRLYEKVARGERDLSYYQITEKNGQPVVRYAKAQIMKSSCIKCHKGSKSPKQDWEEGDLAGVLSVTHPLDRDIERARSGLSGSFLLVGSIATLIVGLAFVLLLAARSQHHRQPS